MANLRQKTIGLPFIVLISQKDDAQHAARIKISPDPKVHLDQMRSYPVEPVEWKAGPRLSRADEARLTNWIELNKAVLQGNWDDQIEYTEDAIEKLKTI